MLPNLSGLRLGGAAPKPLQCVPVGETFEDYDSAMGSAPWWAEQRMDPDDDCAICLGRLDQESQSAYAPQEYNLPNTTEVESFFENPACGHSFHRTCIEAAMLEGQRRCPLCRTDIDRIVLETVFTEEALDAEEAAQDSDDPDLPDDVVNQVLSEDSEMDDEWDQDSEFYSEDPPLRAWQQQPGESDEAYARRQLFFEELRLVYMHLVPTWSAGNGNVRAEVVGALDRLQPLLQAHPVEGQWRLVGAVYDVVNFWANASEDTEAGSSGGTHQFGATHFLAFMVLLNRFQLPLARELNAELVQQMATNSRVAPNNPNLRSALVSKLGEAATQRGYTDSYNTGGLWGAYGVDNNLNQYDQYGMGNSGFGASLLSLQLDQLNSYYGFDLKRSKPKVPQITVRGKRHIITSARYADIQRINVGGIEKSWQVDLVIRTLLQGGVTSFTNFTINVREDSSEESGYSAVIMRGPKLVEKAFNAQARIFFAAMAPPAVKADGFVEGDESDFFDAILKALGVWTARDPRTWSIRPSSRYSDRYQEQ